MVSLELVEGSDVCLVGDHQKLLVGEQGLDAVEQGHLTYRMIVPVEMAAWWQSPEQPTAEGGVGVKTFVLVVTVALP